MTLSALEPIIKEIPATSNPRAPTHERRNPSDLAFAIWAAIVLTGLAIVSVALGVAQGVDPAIFAAP